jgi:hypothetical protein
MAKQKRYATRDKLLEVLQKRTTLRIEEVTVPEWNDFTLFLRELTVRQQNEVYEKASGEGVEVKDTVKLLQFACVDKEGNALFEPEDIEILMDQSGLVVTKLIAKISEMNTLPDQETEGNSEPPAAASSTS